MEYEARPCESERIVVAYPNMSLKGTNPWMYWTGPLSSTFSMKPRQLWLIDAGYNLVSFMLAGMVLMGWTGIGAH